MNKLLGPDLYTKNYRGADGGSHRVAAAATLVLIALMFIIPTSSQAAGTYANITCDDAAPAIADSYGGWTPSSSATPMPGVYTQDNCAWGGLHAEMSPSSGNTVGAYRDVGWLYTPPANTTITGFTMQVGGWGSSSPRGVTAVDTSTWRVKVFNPGDLVWPTKYTVSAYGISSSSLRISSGCDSATGCSVSTAWNSAFSPVIQLSDDAPPVAGAVSGSAKDDATWKGTKTLAYAATDTGGGIAKYRMYVDGAKIAENVPDTFAGHCQIINNDNNVWNFGWPKPCPGSVSTTESIDTTTLSDGPHTITFKVVDAGQREATLYSATKLVANHPPVNTVAPAYEVADVAAKALVGTQIVAKPGTWAGPSLSFVQGWQRCDSAGANCAQIPSATALSYTPVQDDIGHRLRFAVTATNVADSITAYSNPTGVVASPSSGTDTTIKPPAGNGSNGTDGKDGTNGGNGLAPVVTLPPLTTSNTTNNASHTFLGRVAGEREGVACPNDKATLKLQHVKGGKLKLAFGKASTVQAELTCTETGKAISGAKLEIATKVGAHPAVASDMTTDGAGHAVLRIAKGASRGVTVGYRMYADDTLARATATLKVLVNGKVSLKASSTKLHNGRPVTLRGALAGGEIPKRGVSLAVQWKDGKRWRPFAQIKTNKKGTFSYAYRFTRTNKEVTYRLRVQVVRGQVDYPYVPATSKAIKVTVAP